ncbi:MAG: amino acid permease, partial [Lachnospiraceae bacterium]|nr:amino acid permease [Lachnospiraceae bacterium]
NVAGFEVYILEAVFSVFALIIAGAIVLHGGKTTQCVQSVFAILLIGGIVLSASIIFIITLRNGGISLKPAFSKNGSPAMQVFRIIALAPWAYAGFESISQSAEEFKFSPKKSLSIMIFSLIAGILAYSLLSIIAISFVPERYGDWAGYIGNLENIDGIEGLPTFYAMQTALPRIGFIILGITLLSGIMTGLIGNMVAASRLLYSMSRDDLLPKHVSGLNKNSIPTKIIVAITIVSLVIPFFGRTAISWIVDVNTIGATIAYLLTSFVAFKVARDEKNLLVTITGFLGIIISFVFTMYFLVPNFWSASTMSEQSYLIFILWGILGFVFFYYVFKRDTKNRFGKNTVVWLVLLFLVLFVSLLWFRESSKTKSEEILINLNKFNETELAEHGVTLDKWEMNDSEDYLWYQLNELDAVLIRNSILQMAVVIFLLFILFRLLSLLHERERKTEREKIKATESSKAKTMFLSNMSHDIRTPMNAIVGYTELAKELPDTPEDVQDYLSKIDHSSRHLLNLINDILDMSRIESGKIEIYPENMNLLEEISGIKDTFDGQMKEKNLVFKVDMDAVKDS